VYPKLNSPYQNYIYKSVTKVLLWKLGKWGSKVWTYRRINHHMCTSFSLNCSDRIGGWLVDSLSFRL